MADDLQLRALTDLESLEDATGAAEAYVSYRAAREQAQRRIKDLDRAAHDCLVPWLKEHGAIEVAGNRIYAAKDSKVKRLVENEQILEACLEAVGGDVQELAKLLSSGAFKQAAVKAKAGEAAWSEMYRKETGHKLEIRAIPAKMLEKK